MRLRSARNVFAEGGDTYHRFEGELGFYPSPVFLGF